MIFEGWPPLGGNLHSLVESSLELITEMVNPCQDPPQLEIDMVYVMSGWAMSCAAGRAFSSALQGRPVIGIV